MKYKVMFNFLLKQMYSDRRGTNKNPDKTFKTKDPLTKLLDKNPHEQLRQKLYKGLLSGFFVLGLLNIGGGPRCVTYFRGVPRYVTRGRGGKNWPKIA